MALTLHTPQFSHYLAKTSQLVHDLCEVFPGSDQIPTVKIMKVKSDVLEKVIEFLKKYEHEPMKAITSPLQDHTIDGVVTQKWYKDFIVNISYEKLLELKSAADFMIVGEYTLFSLESEGRGEESHPHF